MNSVVSDPWAGISPLSTGIVEDVLAVQSRVAENYDRLRRLSRWIEDGQRRVGRIVLETVPALVPQVRE
jgi:hypothetical protein